MSDSFLRRQPTPRDDDGRSELGLNDYTHTILLTMKLFSLASAVFTLCVAVVAASDEAKSDKLQIGAFAASCPSLGSIS